MLLTYKLNPFARIKANITPLRFCLCYCEVDIIREFVYMYTFILHRHTRWMLPKRNKAKLLNLAQTVYGPNKQWISFFISFVSFLLRRVSLTWKTKHCGDVQLDVLSFVWFVRETSRAESKCHTMARTVAYGLRNSSNESVCALRNVRNAAK